MQRPLSYPGQPKKGQKPKSPYVSPLMHSLMSYGPSPGGYVSPYLKNVNLKEHPSDDEFEEYDYKSVRRSSISSVDSESSTISQASFRSTSSRPSLSRRESEISSETEEATPKVKPKFKVNMRGSQSPSTWRHRVNTAESKK